MSTNLSYNANPYSQYWLQNLPTSNYLRQSYLNGFLDMCGNITVRGGSIALDGLINQNINPNTYAYCNLTTSTSTFTNGLTVTGATSITGTFSVTTANNTSLGGNLVVSNDTSLNGRMYVGLDASLNGKLYVGKDTAFNGNVVASQNLTINGNTNMLNKLSINAGSAAYNLDISGPLRIFSNNVYNNKTLVLYDSNQSETISTGTTFYGFGVNSNYLSYQTPNVGNTHNFYAGTGFGAINALSFNVASDYRIKENVIELKDVSDSSFSIDGLRPIYYYNKDAQKHDIGFLAHEVQEKFPFLVNGEKDGEETQTLNYIGLIGLLVREVQELKALLRAK